MSSAASSAWQLVLLARYLRTKGVDVGTGQLLNAAAALGEIDVDDRDQLRETLRAILVCDKSGQQLLEDLFEIAFPQSVVASAEPACQDQGQFRSWLHAVLSTLDREQVPVVADQAVLLFGALRSPGQPLRGWSRRKTLAALRLDHAVDAAVRERIRLLRPCYQFEHVAIRAEVRQIAAEIERCIERSVLARSRDLKDPDHLAQHLVRGRIEDADFLTSSPEDIERLRATIHPIAHDIRTSLRRRRVRTRHVLDVRRTIRRSAATAGFPLELISKPRRWRRPDLVLVCDLSDSMAGFSTFVLALVTALAGELQRVRCFGFVNRLAEVPLLDVKGWTTRLQSGWREEQLCGTHSSSDYGAVLTAFLHEVVPELSTHTHVLVLGDARSNYYDPKVKTLERIRDRVTAVSWLNPERRHTWGTGDSAALEYRRVVPMHEVRTVAQLRTFVRLMLTTGERR